VCTALLNELANTKSILYFKNSVQAYLWVVKHNSLTMYDVYIGNSLHILKKVTKTEADKKLATDVRNNIYVFYLLCFGFNKIITIPELMSDNRNFYASNQNKCAVNKSNTNQ
jgi:hypothetical protein